MSNEIEFLNIFFEFFSLETCKLLFYYYSLLLWRRGNVLLTNCAWSQFAIKHRHTQYDDYDDFLTTTFNYHCFYNLHCGTFASHNTFNFSYKLWAKFCVFFGRRLSEVGAWIIFLGIKRVRQLKKISRKCAVLFLWFMGNFMNFFSYKKAACWWELNTHWCIEFL